MGHYRSQYKDPKDDGDKESNANSVVDDSDDALIFSLESKLKSWVLDLGQLFHVTSKGELFHNYIFGDVCEVYVDDDQACDVVNKGECRFT